MKEKRERKWTGEIENSSRCSCIGRCLLLHLSTPVHAVTKAVEMAKLPVTKGLVVAVVAVVVFIIVMNKIFSQKKTSNFSSSLNIMMYVQILNSFT